MGDRGTMCVYLNCYGAHTTRWSGGGGTNFQNFKRNSLIRKAMCAPVGCRIVKADLSQIECRVLNYLAGEWEIVQRFAEGHDPYIPIASKFYGREITKADQAERGLGKQLELSCGYGSGGPTIKRTAKRGTYGPPVELTDQQAMDARDLYRSTHPNVVAYWKQASRMIAALAGTNGMIEWGPLLVDTGVIRCQGLPMWYPEMHFHRDEETGEENWRYKTRKGWDKIYGGKLTQNICELVARLLMSQSLLRILARTGIRPAQLEHDAAVWIVPEKLVDPFVTVVNVEMTRAPTWLPGIPLACEVSIGDTM